MIRDNEKWLQQAINILDVNFKKENNLENLEKIIVQVSSVKNKLALKILGDLKLLQTEVTNVKYSSADNNLTKD